jgi:ABC-type transporter Mla subunit MlaD
MSVAAPRLGEILRIASLLALALALAYSGYGLHRAVDGLRPVAGEIASISAQIEATRQTLEPLIEATPAALDQVERVQERVPEILAELERYRVLVPEVLAEIEAVRAQVPTALASVTAIEDRVAALQADLPRILSVSEEAISTARDANTSIQQGIALVPEILSESEALRDTIPPSLDRLDSLLEGASKASKSAGRGVWRGFIRGVISTPIDLLRDAEETLLRSVVFDGKASSEDFDSLNEVADELLSTQGETQRNFVNPSTGNGGSIELVDRFERDGRKCRRLRIVLQPKEGVPEEFGKTVCLDDRGSWEVVESDR